VTGPTDDLAPLFTRDGTRLAFLRQTARDQSLLMLAAADGSGVRPIVDTPLTSPDWLEWSPDDRMAVVHTLDGKRVLSIVDVEARTLQTLDLGGREVDNAVYSRPPDGAQLIFTARPAAGEPTDVGVYSIRPDGSDLSLIAPLQTGPAVYLDLDVSPDGSSLSYWNWENDDSADGKGSHIHLLDIASGLDQRVTFDPTASGETGMRYSPDGLQVVLASEHGSRAQLMVSPTDRSEPGRLVGPAHSIESETTWGFSPDGAKIVLSVGSAAPVFIDAATGEVNTAPDSFGIFSGWQRRAP
jgi:Tol biopolymer transport system component